MFRTFICWFQISWACVVLGLLTQPCCADNVSSLVDQLRSVDVNGGGHTQAISAWHTLAQSDADQLGDILPGLDGAGPLAANWIRAAMDTIAEREWKRSGTLPLVTLEAHIEDRSRDPRGRRWAYEWLVRLQPDAADRWLPNLLDDPSLELRRDAVARVLMTARELEGEGKKAGAISAFNRAFRAARDLDQVQLIVDELKALDVEVDLPKHFGFLVNWYLIGPFDSTGGVGFDATYPPEDSVELGAKLPGKSDDVSWSAHVTDDSFGTIDLNTKLGKHKGSVAYAYTEFIASEPRDVQLRLGCINANKVWLNGELLTANDVYHAGMELDQYRAKAQLRAGSNAILVKVCQNEQTESWAQRWSFQLRVCDAQGTAVLPVTAPGGN